MQRFLLDMKKYFKYSVFQAKQDLKTEVANSYLNWIWWVLDSSVYEGFGLPVLEAMCGIPVIVSKSSSLTKIAGDAGIFSNPYNVEDIADKLQQVYTNHLFAVTYTKRGIA